MIFDGGNHLPDFAKNCFCSVPRGHALVVIPNLIKIDQRFATGLIQCAYHVVCSSGLQAFFPRPPPNITPSLIACCFVAPSVRFNLRAITVVFVFSRASVFSVRTSSFVHGRSFVVFFAILFPMPALFPNQPPSYSKRCDSVAKDHAFRDTVGSL
jgi:hypothetical protein